MYVWRNEKIRRLYDLERIASKNHGQNPFTDEELSDLSLKAKSLQSINDPKMKRIVELAYTLGRLNGLKTADGELEEPLPVLGKPSADVIAPGHVRPQVLEERLYILACRVKNRQDKLIYTAIALKARTESEAADNATTEFRMKNQFLTACKVIRSFGADTMQFQFGISQKELDTLAAQGKKLL